MVGGTNTQEHLARRYQHRVAFFVREIASRYRVESRWRDDLESAGYWGLAKALDARRPDASPREFSAYVSQRIVGAVIDEARVCLTRGTARELLASGAAGADSGDFDPEEWLSRMAGDTRGCPERAAVRRRLRDRLEDGLRGFCPEDRSLLRAYMEGASLTEIAASRGVPLGTLRGRFVKLTRRLRGCALEMRRNL